MRIEGRAREGGSRGTDRLARVKDGVTRKLGGERC